MGRLAAPPRWSRLTAWGGSPSLLPIQTHRKGR